MSAAIWWVRRDLRLADNEALTAATRAGDVLIPVFVLDPTLLSAFQESEQRLAFLFGGLRALDADLRERGSRLIVRQGDPQDELARLVRETGASGVYAEENGSPYARRRDAAVAAVAPLRLGTGLTVRPPDLVRKADGGVYTVFTPFARAWKALPLPRRADLLPAPEHLAAPPDPLTSVSIPDTPMRSPAVPFPPGEREALRRLEAFAGVCFDFGAREHPERVDEPTLLTKRSQSTLAPALSRDPGDRSGSRDPGRSGTSAGEDAALLTPASHPSTAAANYAASAQDASLLLAPCQSLPIFAYADARNRMDLDGTSQLSPYLRFGMISARQCAAAAIEAADSGNAARGAETWLSELIWREFYAAILCHFPHVLREEFQTKLRGIRWANDPAHFSAWCDGCTGYPAVDAAMRQLVRIGWMHNRARMIAASFLVKDLLIDWRWGERFFMRHLIDGDPAANNGGWQWTAGVGTDAAPYFRVFNPTLQGLKFDPTGAYARRWIPELARVPDRFIHAPWTMPAEVQRQAGCVIGRDYPAPIVEHGAARERVLAAYGETAQEAG